jgi:hypothetical protein
MRDTLIDLGRLALATWVLVGLWLGRHDPPPRGRHIWYPDAHRYFVWLVGALVALALGGPALERLWPAVLRLMRR